MDLISSRRHIWHEMERKHQSQKLIQPNKSYRTGTMWFGSFYFPLAWDIWNFWTSFEIIENFSKICFWGTHALAYKSQKVSCWDIRLFFIIESSTETYHTELGIPFYHQNISFGAVQETDRKSVKMVDKKTVIRKETKYALYSSAGNMRLINAHAIE